MWQQKGSYLSSKSSRKQNLLILHIDFPSFQNSNLLCISPMTKNFQGKKKSHRSLLSSNDQVI